MHLFIFLFYLKNVHECIFRNFNLILTNKHTHIIWYVEKNSNNRGVYVCVCVDLLLFLLLLGFKYLNGDLKLIFYLFKQKKKSVASKFIGNILHTYLSMIILFYLH
jgi:hypothetical protein